MPGPQLTFADEEEAAPEPTLAAEPVSETLELIAEREELALWQPAGLPALAITETVPAPAEDVAALLRPALALAIAAGQGNLESVLLAGPLWLALTASHGAFHATGLPAGTNVRLATMALRQHKTALAGMDLPQATPQASALPGLPVLASEWPTVAAALKANEPNVQAYQGQKTVLATAGSAELAAAAEQLWRAAREVNPDGDRLLVNFETGGVAVGTLGEECLVVLPAGSASELAARNLQLSRLQGGSGG